MKKLLVTGGAGFIGSNFIKYMFDKYDDYVIVNLAEGLEQTINWYLNNREWWQRIRSGQYQNYYEKMYDDR